MPIKNNTKQGYKEAYANDGIYYTNIKNKRGMVQSNMIQTIKTAPDIAVITHDLRARKLTGVEVMKLMGFTELDYRKIKDKMSYNQIYKQAGNSIVVNVLEAVFKQLI